MDDFTVYGDSFDKCLENLSLVLKICIETNFVLNYEKCYFMVEQGIILEHVVSSHGLEVGKFLSMFYQRFLKYYSTLVQIVS
jgi:hypothetical protein